MWKLGIFYRSLVIGIITQVFKRKKFIMNIFGYTIVNNYFDIRERFCLFPGYSSIFANYGLNSDTHTSKNYGGFVSFKILKILSPQEVSLDV